MTEEMSKEEMKSMLKGFIAKALSMDEVDSYCIVAKGKLNSNEGVKTHFSGSELEIYGLLDYVKRRMFVDMAERSERSYPKKHNSVTRAELSEIIREIFREEIHGKDIPIQDNSDTRGSGEV